MTDVSVAVLVLIVAGSMMGGGIAMAILGFITHKWMTSHDD
jgi:uncharacterized protein with ACT and thioredoxin-like domain